MNPYDPSTLTYGAPIVDALIMGNWGYIPFKWSDSPLLITVDFVPALLQNVDFEGEHLPQPTTKTHTKNRKISVDPIAPGDDVATAMAIVTWSGMGFFYFLWARFGQQLPGTPNNHL